MRINIMGCENSGECVYQLRETTPEAELRSVLVVIVVI